MNNRNNILAFLQTDGRAAELTIDKPSKQEKSGLRKARSDAIAGNRERINEVERLFRMYDILSSPT